MESDAFYRAERFEDVIAGIERALAQPDELAPSAPAQRVRSSAKSTGMPPSEVVHAVVDAV